MAEKILSVEGINKQYGQLHAVDNLSFFVDKAEIFALLGPNGAGKTTTVRMLNNIIKPDSGNISFKLNSISESVPLANRIGYLPEERGLYPDQKILNIIVYFGTLRGLSQKEARSRALEWLDKMNLKDRAKDKLNTLSKGNQQKIQFIASIIHQPEFIIFDEPFSGLDPINQDFFIKLITGLREKGATIILSAHQMELVEKIADRILLMNNGVRLMQGTLEELQEQSEASKKVIIKFENDFDPAFLLDLDNVFSYEFVDNKELKILINPKADLNSILSSILEKTTIRNIHSQRVNLHDIFVQAVQNANNKQQGGTK